MLICIFALVVFIALIALNFVKANKKIQIMSVLIIVLLGLHIMDELIVPTPHIEHPNYQNEFKKINITKELFKGVPAKSLLKEQRQLLNYINNRWEKKENMIVYIKNIDQIRFKSIFREFQEASKVPALLIDFQRNSYKTGEIQESISKNEDGMIFLLVQNAGKLKQFFDLENLYQLHNMSILLRNADQIILPITLISNWMTVYEFQVNYANQILENHPPRIVQICSKYRTFDFSFYSLSQNEPLSELCSNFPSNRVTQCVKKFLKRVDDQVQFSKVKSCWKGEENRDGVVIENGMVGLKKDYYYAGDIDKNIFSISGMNKQKQL